MSKKRFELVKVDKYVFQVKNKNRHLVAEEVVDLLNELSAKIGQLNSENEQLRNKNKEIGYLKRDLFLLLNLIKDTNLEVNCDYKKIRERWE